MLNIFKKLLVVSNDGKLSTFIKDGAFLVDVRTVQEFADGSVKGAVNIPLDKVQNQNSIIINTSSFFLDVEIEVANRNQF